MATDAEKIATIRSQALDRLVEITAQPKPSYSDNGKSVSWNEYKASLEATVKWCDQQLNTSQPFEFETQLYT